MILSFTLTICCQKSAASSSTAKRASRSRSRTPEEKRKKRLRDRDWDAANPPLLLIRCTNVVYATGGPAMLYANSVFPHGQWGASGAGYRAGVIGKNVTEWQFGLASLRPRWNVSGTYMQVVPRFISTEPDGSDPREFLLDAIPDRGRLASLIFLKGYQWPFDIRLE